MRDCRIQRDATYLLEEARRQVLVDGEVTLLLLSQTRGGLLYQIETESVKVNKRIRADSTASGDHWELTVAALKAAATGRLRASLNMMKRV